MGDSGSWGQNELLFLQSKADAGNLIIVTGSVTSNGVVISYTPATGKTFVLYMAKVTIITSDTATVKTTIQLRNNTTVKDTIGFGFNANTLTPTDWNKKFIIKGDILIGNSSNTYDINLSGISANAIVYGTIIGYLE